MMSLYADYKSEIIFLLIICLIIGTDLIADSDRIRNIVIVGNRFFSDELIRGLMEIKVGQSFDHNELIKDFSRIVEAYQRNGFRFARIEIDEVFVKRFAEGVFLRIPIDEGEIGEISVRGNKLTKQNVIIRDLLFQIGDVYTRDDELESERILRRRPYLSSAEILAIRDNKSNKVKIIVDVAEAWTLMPAIDLPTLSKEGSNLMIILSDQNLIGFGNRASIRYQQIRERNERAKHLVSLKFAIPRLFDSHWEIDTNYTQKREGDSWIARLYRPLYSLQSRWSADLIAKESIEFADWFHDGEKIERYKRILYSHSARFIRSIGNRSRRTLVGLWAKSIRSEYKPIEIYETSIAPFETRNSRMIGVSGERRHRSFVRTNFLDQMGRVEDVELGFGYGVSIGHASPFYDADRSETAFELFWDTSQTYLHDRIFLRSEFRLESLLHAEKLDRTRFTGFVKLIGKNSLPTHSGRQTLRQTFACQISTEMVSEDQVVLGGKSGLRGYATNHFSGEKRIVLNVEDRIVFWEGNSIVIGSAVFADLGWIWETERPQFRSAKKSVGFGLRLSSPKLNGFQVYRFDLAFPLDRGRSSKPSILYAIGQAF